MPILGLEPTHFIFEGYWQHAFNCLGFREKYENIGTRTNTVYFRRLPLARLKLPGPQKDMCRYLWSNQHSLFPKASANSRSTTWAAERSMPILRLEPHSLFPKANGNTHSTTWAAGRNMPIFGLETTQIFSEGYWQHAFNYLGSRKEYADIGTRTKADYIGRLLATRVQLPGLRKEICRY